MDPTYELVGSNGAIGAIVPANGLLSSMSDNDDGGGGGEAEDGVGLFKAAAFMGAVFFGVIAMMLLEKKCIERKGDPR